jgi:hypothetical protein
MGRDPWRSSDLSVSYSACYYREVDIITDYAKVDPSPPVSHRLSYTNNLQQFTRQSF